MCIDIEDNNEDKMEIEEEDNMVTNTTERYCTVTESIVDSFQQIKQIQEGKLERRTLQDLWDTVDKWVSEIESEDTGE